MYFFFFQAEDGIRDYKVTGVQTCALPICLRGEHVRYEREVPQPDGPPRHIESLLMPHFEHGQLQGAVVQITDVSHHHHVAQKVRDSEERMRKFTEIGRASCRERV